MLAIVDYDTGNVRNVQKALNYLGIENVVTADPDVFAKAQGLILPGVGAFQKAMAALQQRHLVGVLQQAAQHGQPILGICLGMQLLFYQSEEFGTCQGLGILPGKVVAIPQTPGLLVPHMGWNQNHAQKPGDMGAVFDQQYTYFVHSYYVQTASKNIVCTADYGVAIPSVVQQNNVYGMQFHPEKSGAIGLKGLQVFKEVAENGNFARN